MFVFVTEIKQNVQTNLSRHVPVPRDYKIVINYKTIHTFKENTHTLNLEDIFRKYSIHQQFFEDGNRVP